MSVDLTRGYVIRGNELSSVLAVPRTTNACWVFCRLPICHVHLT